VEQIAFEKSTLKKWSKSLLKKWSKSSTVDLAQPFRKVDLAQPFISKRKRLIWLYLLESLKTNFI